MKKTNANGQLSMNRAGEFRVKTYGDSHCGIKEDLLIKYNVIVACEVSLDDRGFLFDQITVDKYFQAIKSTKLSCERFAIQCARDLWKVILAENGACAIKDMALTLSPEPHAASMTFSYNSQSSELAAKKKRVTRRKV